MCLKVYLIINEFLKLLFKSYLIFLKLQAFRICQLRAHGVQNLNYEERIELWNLENEQFAELLIHPTLTYYHRYFERGPVQTDKDLGWRNIWRRVQEDDAACLRLLRMSLLCFFSLCNVL